MMMIDECNALREVLFMAMNVGLRGEIDAWLTTRFGSLTLTHVRYCSI
jgi:hypothetical protein